MYCFHSLTTFFLCKTLQPSANRHIPVNPKIIVYRKKQAAIRFRYVLQIC
jgi:hypothetical protein